jgi:hypothetical protein
VFARWITILGDGDLRHSRHIGQPIQLLRRLSGEVFTVAETRHFAVVQEWRTYEINHEAFAVYQTGMTVCASGGRLRRLLQAGAAILCSAGRP